MAYFLPSFFQKRLLRYALSRLELVDTEALDLDSLGIRWGQRSTVELRDIGLRLEKLATLLQLPASSELLSAKVQFLKITVPADIYSSGIICEASGINVHLQLPSEESFGAAKDENPNSRRPSQAGTHDSSSDHILPTPADLAESFLDAEPKEEKEELQAAITSRSQVLHRTSASISDDEEELGLGNEGVSLPSFVAAFLKGVAERLQVKVDNVSIRVDMETKQEGVVKREPENKPDNVTGLLTVREVSVGAVSSATSSSEEEKLSRNRNRPIVISDINMALISEPIVFSNYSRFAPPTSPTTPVQPKSSEPSSRIPSPLPGQASDADSVLAMTRSTILEPSQEHSIQDIEEPGVGRMEGSAYTYDGRFSDADTDDENRSDGYLEGSQQFLDDDKLLDNPAYLDSVIDSQLHDDDLEPPEDLVPQDDQFPPSSETLRSQTPEVHMHRETSPSNIDTEHTAPFSHYGDGSFMDRSPHGSQPYLETDHVATPDVSHSASSPSGSLPSRENSDRQTAPPSESGSVGSSDVANGGELSESKLFSNEEAQSMYMSAISHGSSRSFVPNIPGAWDLPESTVVRDVHAGTQLTDAADAKQDVQDETLISTPKLTAQAASALTEKRSFGEQSECPSEAREPDLTPLSPTLSKLSDVAKRFLRIDRISISIPVGEDRRHTDETVRSADVNSASDSLKDSAMRSGHSSTESELLSSTMYASARLRSDSISSEPSFEGTLPRSPPRQANKADHGPISKSQPGDIAVEISAVDVRFDNAIGWLVVKTGQRVLHAFRDGGNVSSGKPAPESVQTRHSLALTLHNFCIKYVDHIPGQTYALNDYDPHSSSPFGLPHEDIILRATASGLTARYLADKNVTKFGLDVSKFVFGFASDDLISFSESLKMRESTRDVLSPVNGDISLSLTKSSDSASLTITTLPLRLYLNVQRLEEVFGRVGGLSTILELGNSISSVSSGKNMKRDSQRRARGVHFESSPPPENNLQANPQLSWKVNARVGGIVFDVAGETHYLRLKTTAVKVVSRFEGIGVQIDKAKLSGPLPLDDSRDAPAKINLSNIRVEFLYSPKEPDLDRLLAIITPSKDKYDEDDDIMLDTLFRQRRQGSVLRTTVAGAKIVVSRTSDLESLSQLEEELGKLSTVAKYLPEDDRPGILTLTLIRELESQVYLGGPVGNITTHLRNAEAAYISMPSLIAAQLGTIKVVRNGSEELVGEALPASGSQGQNQSQLPILMARYIADEMDPTIKIKSHNLRVEYTIPSIIAFLGLSEDQTTGDVAANMANSLANIAESQHLHRNASEISIGSKGRQASAKPSRLAFALRDCVLGLNPRGTTAKGLVVLTNAKFSAAISDSGCSEAMLDIKKASIMLIDDVKNMGLAENLHRGRSTIPQSDQIQSFIDMGFVPVSSISSAMATVKLMQLDDDGTKSLDVELKDDLLILETCADSTQTLISIINGLQPPTPPSVAVKYRTEVLPIEDMLASFSGDAFAMDPPPEQAEIPEAPTIVEPEDGGPGIEDELEYVSDFYPVKSGPDNLPPNESAVPSESNDLLDSFHSQYYVSSSVSDLEFKEDHFANHSAVGGTAHRWDSTQNTYGLTDDSKIRKSPLRIRVRDAHIIWNLFDGYDWQRTRDTISKAVKDVEKRATERRARAGSRASPGFEEEEESVIGDCLFNSIYIGIPANKDPRELRNDINHNIDDLASETGSYATTTTVTGATARQGQSPSYRGRRLKLSRSKYHKMTFELKGICADFVVFPPGSEETQSSLDVRVNDLEIFDHVPTSTWKKFATYMHEAGERESGASMVHLEMLTVRPVPELAASELVLKATLLPLRLHVDQDALDFICRFFEFRDDSALTPSSPADIPFLQRVEVNAVPVKLDFKPKRVDYAGLRSGRTTEFMNFFVLDGADMVMRHVIIYGVSGFDKLGQTLNDIWMPDIKRNQLPGVLAGLAPIRSLVNVGGGVKDLVVVPMREYRKDGRLVRSIQKGALAFAKTTSNELVKLGAKLAIGTQTVLQGAEEMLTTPTAPTLGSEEDMIDEEEANKISPYADQPVGVVQGLRGAFRGLERDLLLARDAIVAVPGEIVESGSAKAAARAVFKRAPTVILRPAIGVSKAVGQTLLGAGNTLDPSNRRKIEDKYKRH
ncbi:putative autophagy regulatory protein Atg2 [Aspergillus fischeri NRRL 181]|uniref:Autophagy-related protein 2 n=1 Tax=Neosartorya fischeri (strain ATCC 1020 / DSM 3700 / CBS 544.65 / FGSC A1164 / JCM 1740 / NRRL 181 / WB 181) TaxID=331117 RepID=ATG2_NEOFI|nr:autophagy regulatory protein Atg2, putative [Aspergillus fischeri NRRL 181]A1DP40.1 RecName: Full=Autophagy-related protein 2 [Aspergillus fischeri NRRL 181]EAW16561.1 autophagy regulatory protein Atg2, putative [Aspergillus fischeri NRRL 181]